MSVSLSKGETIELHFGETVYFDTVALYENGDNCNEFRLYAKTGGEWTMIYQQDRILTYHLCYVEPMYADALRLEIVDCNDDVKIRELSVYEAEKRTQPVTVTQYLRLDACDFETLADDEGFTGYYDVVTDPILFGEVSLDEDANIRFAHSEEFFRKQLASFRQIIGDDPSEYGAVLYLTSGTVKASTTRKQPRNLSIRISTKFPQASKASSKNMTFTVLITTGSIRRLQVSGGRTT